MTVNDEQHYKNILDNTLLALKKYKKILFLTTSSRWQGEKNKEKPKSTVLAYEIAKRLKKSSNVSIIEVPLLNIYPCEGNVSTKRGNSCGQVGAKMEDQLKNPSGYHRCWASINNKDDELWKISKELFESDCVIFFGSVRWGQMSSEYQKLIERLTWIENRHTTLQEENIIQNIDAGIIIISQNWNGPQVLDIQKKVLQFFGFNTIDDLSWNWQYTDIDTDETNESYVDAAKKFAKIFLDDNG